MSPLMRLFITALINYRLDSTSRTYLILCIINQIARQRFSLVTHLAKLKVVQQHKVHQVASYWFGFGPIAANQVLDDLEKYVLYQNSGIN
jgi:hypothetical protein